MAARSPIALPPPARKAVRAYAAREAVLARWARVREKAPTKGKPRQILSFARFSFLAEAKRQQETRAPADLANRLRTGYVLSGVCNATLI